MGFPSSKQSAAIKMTACPRPNANCPHRDRDFRNGSRHEVCFFSAWDFHLPAGGSWQLIEFNDNGSGFLFAAIINAVYCEAAGLGSEQGIASPAGLPASEQHIVRMVEEEAKAFSGERPAGLFLVLDDAESIQRGKFRKELQML